MRRQTLGNTCSISGNSGEKGIHRSGGGDQENESSADPGKKKKLKETSTRLLRGSPHCLMLGEEMEERSPLSCGGGRQSGIAQRFENSKRLGILT